MMPITTTSPRIISLRFISNKFPRLLAEREIIANALSVRYFSSEPWAKIVNYSGTPKLYRYFSRKRHGVAPVPQLSDGDFTCLDVVASKFAVTIPQIKVLTSYYYGGMRFFVISEELRSQRA
jgi:hypothetical protein